MILIQGAMDVETDWLAAQLEGRRAHAVGSVRFWSGTVGGLDLSVGRTGVGMVNCACATALGVQLFAPALVLNQGVAGGHRADLHTGDIVVGETCTAIHDLETSVRGRGAGMEPGLWQLRDHAADGPPRVYRGAPEWAARFLAAPYSGGRKIAGRLGSGDVFNREHDRILWLREQAGQDCEDMESAAAYQVCAALGVPCLGVRILSNNELTGEPYQREMGLRLQALVLKVLLAQRDSGQEGMA